MSQNDVVNRIGLVAILGAFFGIFGGIAFESILLMAIGLAIWGIGFLLILLAALSNFTPSLMSKIAWIDRNWNLRFNKHLVVKMTFLQKEPFKYNEIVTMGPKHDFRCLGKNYFKLLESKDEVL